MESEPRNVDQTRMSAPPHGPDPVQSRGSVESDLDGMAADAISPDDQPTTTMRPVSIPNGVDGTEQRDAGPVPAEPLASARLVPVTSSEVSQPVEAAPESSPAPAAPATPPRGFAQPEPPQPAGYATPRYPPPPWPGRVKPRPPTLSHMPWQATQSWGSSTILVEANTAAGISYLFWWLSGLFVYFNERENRYVRFHAMQSIMLTGALTVFSVLAYVIAALFNDISLATQQFAFHIIAVTIGWLAACIVIFVWFGAMIAAWSGNFLRLPIVGAYAERFAAPPTTPSEPY